jgi:hypothetical protein
MQPILIIIIYKTIHNLSLSCIIDIQEHLKVYQPIYRNRISCSMVSVLASSVVDRRFETR